MKYIDLFKLDFYIQTCFGEVYVYKGKDIDHGLSGIGRARFDMIDGAECNVYGVYEDKLYLVEKSHGMATIKYCLYEDENGNIEHKPQK